MDAHDNTHLLRKARPSGTRCLCGGRFRSRTVTTKINSVAPLPRNTTKHCQQQHCPKFWPIDSSIKLTCDCLITCWCRWRRPFAVSSASNSSHARLWDPNGLGRKEKDTQRKPAASRSCRWYLKRSSQRITTCACFFSTT